MSAADPVLRPAVTLRAVALGLLGVVLDGVWIAYYERIRDRGRGTTASLFLYPVVLLTLLCVVNGWVRRRAPERALRQGELLVIYGMLSLGAAMGAIDFGASLLTMIAHPTHFATADNGWMRFVPLLPRWLVVTDADQLATYYAGGGSLWRAGALRAWLPVLAAWGGFVAVLLATMDAINALLREPWTHAERLAFPIVQLPLAMTDDSGALARSRLFWLGFGSAGGWSLLCGLNFVDPRFPALSPNGFDLGPFFAEPPWSAIGYQSGRWLPAGFFPFVVGIGYLLPTDLLFSCWFFFVLTRGEQVAVNALGWQADGSARFPYLEAQAFGAYVSVCAFALWGARRHLAGLWARFDRPTDDGAAARSTLLRILIGVLALTIFAAAAGMPPIVGGAFFAVYFVIAIAITRMRAELGPPTHDLHFIGPTQTLYHVFGNGALGPQALTSLTLFYWCNRAFRAHPMPHLLEAQVAVRQSGSARGLSAALIGAALLGLFVYLLTVLDAAYHLGAAAKIRGWGSLGYGNEAYGRLLSWLSLTAPSDRREVGGMGVGFLVATALMLLRQRLVGFPLHAFGYALAGGFSMLWCWESLLVAWALKVLLLRFGGLAIWRQGVPLAFGLILGDFLMGALWSMLGIFLDIPVYSHFNG
jgi:hypothetical protein